VYKEGGGASAQESRPRCVRALHPRRTHDCTAASYSTAIACATANRGPGFINPALSASAPGDLPRCSFFVMRLGRVYPRAPPRRGALTRLTRVISRERAARGAIAFHRCRVPSRAPLPVCVRESRVLKWGERHAASACALKSDATHDIDVTRADAPKRSCASLCAIGGARSASRAVSHDVTRGIGD